MGAFVQTSRQGRRFHSAVSILYPGQSSVDGEATWSQSVSQQTYSLRRRHGSAHFTVRWSAFPSCSGLCRLTPTFTEINLLNKKNEIERTACKCVFAQHVTTAQACVSLERLPQTGDTCGGPHRKFRENMGEFLFSPLLRFLKKDQPGRTDCSALPHRSSG